jgi:hypothetical protein
MIDLRQARADLHTDLGYKRLFPAWAKLEIFGGLLAAGLGNLAVTFACVALHGAADGWYLCLLGVGLFVFGGYLALAGQRSHLYQSENERTAYLLEQIRRSQQLASLSQPTQPPTH